MRIWFWARCRDIQSPIAFHSSQSAFTQTSEHKHVFLHVMDRKSLGADPGQLRVVTPASSETRLSIQGSTIGIICDVGGLGSRGVISMNRIGVLEARGP
eukprot:8844776-Pyramimonas_sp.AAC.1